MNGTLPTLSGTYDKCLITAKPPNGLGACENPMRLRACLLNLFIRRVQNVVDHPLQTASKASALPTRIFYAVARRLTEALSSPPTWPRTGNSPRTSFIYCGSPRFYTSSAGC
jgi:hypothetical protein